MVRSYCGFLVKDEEEKGLVFTRMGSEERPWEDRLQPVFVGTLGVGCPEGGDGGHCRTRQAHPLAPQPHKGRALGAQSGPSWMAAGNWQSCLPPQLLGTIALLRQPIVSSKAGTQLPLALMGLCAPIGRETEPGLG